MLIKSNRRKLSIALCAMLILAILIVLTVTNEAEKDVAQADNLKFSDVVGIDSDGFTPHDGSTAIIPATTGLEFESGQIEQAASLYNPITNQCTFVISLYLSDATLLFVTDPLAPGEVVDSVMLYEVLNRGIYHNALLVYDCYATEDGNMMPLSRCELVVEINSK